MVERNDCMPKKWFSTLVFLLGFVIFVSPFLLQGYHALRQTQVARKVDRRAMKLDTQVVNQLTKKAEKRNNSNKTGVSESTMQSLGKNNKLMILGSPYQIVTLQGLSQFPKSICICQFMMASVKKCCKKARDYYLALLFPQAVKENTQLLPDILVCLIKRFSRILAGSRRAIDSLFKYWEKNLLMKLIKKRQLPQKMFKILSNIIQKTL